MEKAERIRKLYDAAEKCVWPITSMEGPVPLSATDLRDIFIKGAHWADDNRETLYIKTGENDPLQLLEAESLLWAARNKNGWLRIFTTKPKRTYECWEGEYWFGLNNNEIPELKWEDEPIRVALVKINPELPKE